MLQHLAVMAHWVALVVVMAHWVALLVVMVVLAVEVCSRIGDNGDHSALLLNIIRLLRRLRLSGLLFRFSRIFNVF